MATTGHVVELRVVQPVQQVDRARAAGRRAHPDLAGELREPDRLERGHLLVPGLHELRVVRRPPPRREQSVDPVAGIPEDLLHAPFPQPGQQDVADGV